MARKNILLLFPDQFRGDWLEYDQVILEQMGIHNLPLKTPFLKSLMQDGVTFLNTTSPAPICAPARACLALGASYQNCYVKSNDIDMNASRPTFYNMLNDSGYDVLGVGKFDLHKGSHRWAGENGFTPLIYQLGFTDGVDSGGKMDAVNYGRDEERCEPYMRYLASRGLKQAHIDDMTKRDKRVAPSPLPDDAYTDNFITRNALNVLDSVRPERPFFLQVNFAGPHGPFDVTNSMRERVKGRTFESPHLYSEEDGVDINGVRQNYAAMIENIDANCAAIVNKLKERGVYEDTVIIFSADHGEMLGDRNRFAKCLPYRGAAHIPLIIAVPDGRKGIVTRALASLEDLANTILEFATGKTSELFADSVSLAPIVNGTKETVREYSVSQLDDLYMKGVKKYIGYRMIRDERYKYIRFYDGREEFYDLRSDPFETCNVIEALPEEMYRLKEALVKHMQAKNAQL